MFKERKNPINVRHYFYPHHHKNGIEKRVHELSRVGVIQTNQSVSLSLIILVTKKDDMWRMCIDYWTLNNVTILD